MRRVSFFVTPCLRASSIRDRSGSPPTPRLQLDKKAGVLTNAKGSFEPSISFSGHKLEKLDQKNYRLTNGILTSCDINNPDLVIPPRLGIDHGRRLCASSSTSPSSPIACMLYLAYIVWPTKRDGARRVEAIVLADIWSI